MKKIYHVSKTPNLKVLEPRICSHGKAYVYASFHNETALLFGGGLWSDWDLIYKRNYETGKLTLSETYEGALKKIFDKRNCFIYQVEDSGFKEGQTQMWDEIVSENPTKVLNQKQVVNLFQYLKKLDKISLEFYENSQSYQIKVKKHIQNLSKFSDINLQLNSKFLIEKFGNYVTKKEFDKEK